MQIMQIIQIIQIIIYYKNVENSAIIWKIYVKLFCHQATPSYSTFGGKFTKQTRKVCNLIYFIILVWVFN